MLKKIIAFLPAAGLAASTVLAPAFAQQATPPTAVPPPSIEAGEDAAFEDSKLRSFAVAFLEVRKVGEEYRSQLDAAKTPEDQQKVQQEAGGKMVEAVENAGGITVDEYNQIIETAQGDPQLATRINSMIQENATE